MAKDPNRAVRLVPVGEYVDPGDLSREEVDAYRVVEKSRVLTQTAVLEALKTQVATKNATLKIYSYQNFQ